MSAGYQSSNLTKNSDKEATRQAVTPVRLLLPLLKAVPSLNADWVIPEQDVQDGQAE